MKIPKIITILRNISLDERKEFGNYLNSDFFKVEKPLYDLYKCILNYINKEGYDYTREICKSQNCKENTLQKNYSSLKNHYLKYLLYRYFQKENSFTKIVQSEILLEINDEFLKKEMLANLDEYFESNPDTNIIKTIHEYQYNMDKFMYMVSQKGYYKGKGLSIQQDKINKKLFDVFAQVSFHVIAQYYNTVSLKSENPDAEISDSYMVIEKMIEYGNHIIGNSNLDKSSLILFKTAKLIFNTIKNHDDCDSYIKCVDFILKNREEIDNSLFGDIILIMMGVVSLKISRIKNHNILLEEEARILEIFIKQKIFLKSNPYLHSTHVKNYIMNCMAHRKYDEIFDFLKQFRKYFYHEDREQLSLFILAHYYYGKKDFNLAQKYLTAYDNDDFIYKFDMLNLELKLYFEKVEDGKPDYYKYIHSILHNYDAKIKKTKFYTSVDKERYSLLVKYLKKYLRLLENKNFIKYFSEDLIRLLKQVEGKESFVMRKWMIEHLNKTISENNIKIPPAKHPLKKKSV